MELKSEGFSFSPDPETCLQHLRGRSCHEREPTLVRQFVIGDGFHGYDTPFVTGYLAKTTADASLGQMALALFLGVDH